MIFYCLALNCDDGGPGCIIWAKATKSSRFVLLLSVCSHKLTRESLFMTRYFLLYSAVLYHSTFSSCQLHSLTQKSGKKEVGTAHINHHDHQVIGWQSQMWFEDILARTGVFKVHICRISVQYSVLLIAMFLCFYQDKRSCPGSPCLQWKEEFWQ